MVCLPAPASDALHGSDEQQGYSYATAGDLPAYGGQVAGTAWRLGYATGARG
jgi:hypothetical protein